MSKHIGWHRFYEAVYNDDLATVREALYYLHVRATTTCLESSRTVLEIACRLGKRELVDLLLASHALKEVAGHYNRPYLAKLVTNSYLEACSKGDLYVVKALMAFAKSHSLERTNVDTVPAANVSDDHSGLIRSTETGLRCAARAGALDVVAHLFETFSNLLLNMAFVGEVANLVYANGHDHTVLLKFAEYEAYVQHQVETTMFFDLLHRSDTISLTKVDFLARTVVEQAAAYDRVNILARLLRHQTWPQKEEDLEAAMDLVIDLGRTDVCKLLIRDGYVSLKNDEQWQKRLQIAVDNDKTEMALFLIDTLLQPVLDRKLWQTEHEEVQNEDRPKTRKLACFFSRRFKQKKSITAALPETAVDVLISLLNSAIANDNMDLVKKLLPYLDRLPGASEQMKECMVTAAVLQLPRQALLLHELGYTPKLCGRWRGHELQQTRRMSSRGHIVPDCYFTSLVNGNVVICEQLLGLSCQCWSTDNRIERLQRAIQTMASYNGRYQLGPEGQSNIPCDHAYATRKGEILKLLLKKFREDQANDQIVISGRKKATCKMRLEHQGNDRHVYRTCFNNASSLTVPYNMYDHCLRNHTLCDIWYDFYRLDVSASELTPPRLIYIKLSDICSVVRALSGQTIGPIVTDEHYDVLEILRNLSEENKHILDQYLRESGLKLVEREDNERPWHQLTVSPISLKNQCRLSIRQSIRSACSIGSLDDEILSFHKERSLPSPLVEFLLHRYDYLPSQLLDVNLNRNGVPTTDPCLLLI